MAQQEDSDVLLYAARHWDGLAERPAGPVRVLVRGGRIAEVGPNVRAGSARVVDLGDRLLLPGFIDCHVHTTIDPAHLTGAFATDSATVIALRALPVLRTLLDHGFTTVRDLGTFTADPVTVHLRDAVAAGRITGPRMIVAPHLISATGGHGDLSGLLSPQLGRTIGALADGPAAIVRAVRADIRAGADWIKFGATGGFATPSDDPGEASYTQEEMNTLVATARDLGVPCTPHAYGDEGVARAVRAGVRSVEHGNLASPRTLAMMQERGVFLVPTQMMALGALDHLEDDSYWVGKDPAERVKFERYADDLRASAGNVATSGVQVAFGTDAGMFPHADSWQEFGYMVRTGISPARALRAATSTAADLLQRPDLGRLRPGAVADLIGMPGDPFDDISATGEVDFVMQEGRVRRAPV